MRKQYFLIFTLLLSTLLFSQNPEIKSDLPILLPPSPTVAALMKFEETPVSNYTGVPDISIPLFNSSSHSKDINLDISLKYHPTEIAADEKSSDVGLGWSLFAGGTISRTVRSLPDEIYDTQGIVANGTGKIGIYHNTGMYPNNYHQVIDFYNTQNSTTTSNNIMNEFLWNTTEKELYDTEFDLWQFNFMGQSGQFTIKKNISNNTLEISSLDKKCNLKVVNIYNSTNYTPISFNIYDELGYKYVFDVSEETRSNSTTSTLPRSGNLITTVSKDIKFKSAFHLTKVYDNNNKLILQLNYSADNEIYLEKVLDRSTTSNDINYLSNINVDFLINVPTSVNMIDPKHVTSITQRRINTKKLKSINVEGKSKIFLNFTKGREDTNLQNPDSSYIFKGIVVKDWNDQIIKKVELEHNYSTILDKRLLLSKVKFIDPINSSEEKFQLEYAENSNSFGNLKKDFWGYLKSPNFFSDESKEVNPSFCTSDLLQKMTLPTGGSVVYDFEPNTYSSIRDISLNNFDENPKNFDEQILATSFYEADNIQNDYVLTNLKPLFTINHQQDVLLVGSVNTSFGEYFEDYIFKVYRVENNVDVEINQIGLVCMQCQEYPKVLLKNLLPGTYKVSFSSSDASLEPIFSNATVTSYFKVKNNNNFQFLYGGGNRIKKIGYFKDNVPKEVYQNFQNFNPEKEKVYNYNFFNNPQKSSGSLVTDKPIFEYDYTSNHYIYIETSIYLCPTSTDVYEFIFTKRTNYNNIKSVKTGGADVGYQNVSVKEINNGESRFVYTSPIDHPDSAALVASYPFILPFSRDYERGLLKKESSFDAAGKILNENIYEYTIEEVPYEQNLYGITTYPMGLNNPFSYLFSNYDIFKSTYNYLHTNCNPDGSSSICSNKIMCKYIEYLKLTKNYIDMQKLYSPNGWSKLKSKNTKNFSYSGGFTNVIETNDNYTYNDINKKIASQTTTASDSGSIKTDYFYHTGNSVYSQNRIAAIEKMDTYKNSNLISSNKINYSNSWTSNVAYLPQSIATLTANQTLENRLIYNAYDEFGNPLEVQQESGMLISYIWGYNQTQPIAKIENASYASVQSQVANLQALSNTATEDNLIQALNSLRTSLPNAMVTTYTYKPLIGVSTVTDPKGDKITYFYDSFNRLKEVKDKNNNLLSENQYNYRQ